MHINFYTYFRSRNPFKRRGASLHVQQNLTPGNARSARQSGSLRSSPSFTAIKAPSSPSLRFLLSRRHLYHDDAETGSSETVIVKSLPLLADLHRPPLPGLSRTARDPQLNRFPEEVEVFRGAEVVEQPRSAALLAPVQNILPEPIAAVPNLPVRNRLTGISAIQATGLPRTSQATGLPASLRPLPAVPGLPGPTRPSFTETTRQSFFSSNRPSLPATSSRPAFGRASVSTTREPFPEARNVSPVPTAPSLLDQTVPETDRGATLVRGRQRLTSPSTLPRRVVTETSFTSSRQLSRALGRDGPAAEKASRNREFVREKNGLTTPFGREKEVLVSTRSREAATTTPSLHTTGTRSRTRDRSKERSEDRQASRSGGGLNRELTRGGEGTNQQAESTSEGVAESTLDSIQPPVTTRRPLETLTRILETTKREEIINHPELG